ncbi:ABC transporter permease family protein [Gracilibacillus alcaliphilus]|uniref:hypothetical protein n=1 Tax=Gracilibacillus alcaliphilus TaxID=1401441 RepID=UPI00195C578A|nr:hypothetical protein [Gracilibacillus alcaliphilus]
MMSIKTPQETSADFFALPSAIQWSNFADAIEQAKIVQSFSNSIIVTVSTVLLVIICASTAGYAIARYYQIKSLRMYQLLLLASMMLPFQTIIRYIVCFGTFHCLIHIQV